MKKTLKWLKTFVEKTDELEFISREEDVELHTQFRSKKGQAKFAKNAMEYIRTHERPELSEDEIFELAETLADEAFGKKGMIEYSDRQELTVKFNELLVEKIRK